MRRIGWGVAAAISVGFFFQNCGKSGLETSDMTSQLGVPGTAQVTSDPKLIHLPFPYEVSVNQIAHMSCAFPDALDSGSTHFSFAVGAYDNPADAPTQMFNIRPSGLRLSPAFLQAFSQAATIYSPSIVNIKLKEALLGLPGVAGNQLQLSFRKFNVPKTDLMPVPGGISPAVPFLSVLSTDAIADTFVADRNAVVNYFSRVNNFSERPLGARFKIASPGNANFSALNAQYDAGFLALGYASAAPGAGGTAEVLAGPSADARYAYGKGFRVHFGTVNPHVSDPTLPPPSVPPMDSLASVEEYEMDSGARTAGVGWDCGLKMKIVRNEDRYRPAYLVGSSNPVATCPAEPYSPPPESPDDGLFHPSHRDRPGILHALRRFLPADQWDINVSRHCIVPKKGGSACYGSGTVVYDEVFFPGTAADPAKGMYPGCGVDGQFPCAAYLTMCIRK